MGFEGTGFYFEGGGITEQERAVTSTNVGLRALREDLDVLLRVGGIDLDHQLSWWGVSRTMAGLL